MQKFVLLVHHKFYIYVGRRCMITNSVITNHSFGRILHVFARFLRHINAKSLQIISSLLNTKKKNHSWKIVGVCLPLIKLVQPSSGRMWGRGLRPFYRFKFGILTRYFVFTSGLAPPPLTRFMSPLMREGSSPFSVACSRSCSPPLFCTIPIKPSKLNCCFPG